GNHAFQNQPIGASTYSPSAADQWWDWTGLGWMAGENPILIIDAALPDVTGDNPRTCQLVLDAHHSIPFQLIESSGRYRAPPRFRARMAHNGAGWIDGVHGWSVAPTQYDVYLYDGQLHYSFVVIREDAPPNRWDSNFLRTNGPDPVWASSSYHDRPF